MMNNDFPRILTLLRNERGMSQKKVAADLGISQALLSHYEKESGNADWTSWCAPPPITMCPVTICWDVRRIAMAWGPTSPGRKSPSQDQPVSPVEDQRRMLVYSINIVFGILQKINSEGLTRHMSAFLSCAVYKMFRLLYGARGKNPQEAFSLDRRLYGAQTDAHMALSEAKARYLLEGGDLEDAAGIPPQILPQLTPEKLSQEYPHYADSLFEVVRDTEQAALEKKTLTLLCGACFLAPFTLGIFFFCLAMGRLFRRSFFRVGAKFTKW